MNLNYLAIAVAAFAAFVVSSVWYAVFGQAVSTARGAPSAAAEARPPLWKMLVELVRSVVVSAVIAWLVARLAISGMADALLLGLMLWIAFPVVLFTGAVIWENVAVKLAAIHSGDWLVKLLIVAAIVSLWR